MSILLDATIDDQWYGDVADRGYMQTQSLARATGLRVRGGTGRFLIAGMGYGYLVSALRSQGVTDTWGVDFSDYAITQAQATHPTISTRFVKGDCRVASQMTSVRSTLLGGPATRRFDVIVVEDLGSACGPLKVPAESAAMYPQHAVYTTADVTAARNEVLAVQAALKGILTTNGTLAWLTSMRQEDTVGYESPGFWLTGEEWRALLGPTDYIERIRDGQGF